MCAVRQRHAAGSKSTNIRTALPEPSHFWSRFGADRARGSGDRALRLSMLTRRHLRVHIILPQAPFGRNECKRKQEARRRRIARIAFNANNDNDIQRDQNSLPQKKNARSTSSRLPQNSVGETRSVSANAVTRASVQQRRQNRKPPKKVRNAAPLRKRRRLCRELC
jgi:hypothetical protein